MSDMERHNDDTMERRFLTVREVAEQLGCSKANVYARIRQGQLPFIWVGQSKAYRIKPVDLDAFVEGRRVQHEAAERPAPRPRLRHIKL